MNMNRTRLVLSALTPGKRRFLQWVVVCSMTTIVCCAQTPAKGNVSVYSDLSGANCKITNTNKETGATIQRCKGTAGWDLVVQYDDQRMSIAVVRPDGSEHPLNFWDVISPGFSTLGPRAEWRMPPAGNEAVREPLAVIVRVNASERQKAGDNKNVSYLAVARLQGSSVCVTAKISPGSNSNEQARQAADKASGAACLAQ